MQGLAARLAVILCVLPIGVGGSRRSATPMPRRMSRAIHGVREEDKMPIIEVTKQ